MKNKFLTYILLAAVCLIWAWIMYSVYNVVNGTEEIVSVSPFVKKIIPEKEQEIKVEYILSLQYKDPFLKKEYHSRQTSADGNSNVSLSKLVKDNSRQQAKPKEEVIVPSVRYVGRINNIKSKKPVAILLISDAEYMMQVGESIHGVTLDQIHKDSVKVSYLKKQFYVRKY